MSEITNKNLKRLLGKDAPEATNDEDLLRKSDAVASISGDFSTTQGVTLTETATALAIGLGAITPTSVSSASVSAGTLDVTNTAGISGVNVTNRIGAGTLNVANYASISGLIVAGDVAADTVHVTTAISSYLMTITGPLGLTSTEVTTNTLVIENEPTPSGGGGIGPVEDCAPNSEVLRAWLPVTVSGVQYYIPLWGA